MFPLLRQSWSGLLIHRLLCLGDNLKNPKVATLTGHGYVSRKPVADDGRSIRSRKSNHTDAFSELPESSGITRVPTNFESSLKDDISNDPGDEFIPGLPKCRHQSSRESFSHGKGLKDSRLAYDAESFDALLSSSPLAQSTPRVGLEPTLERSGRRTLKHLPADSPSTSDTYTSSRYLPGMEVDSTPAKDRIDIASEMDIDSTPEIKQTANHFGGRINRENSFRENGLFNRYSTKTKKHPSPSKKELEGLGKTLKELPPFGTPPILVTTAPSKDVGSFSNVPQVLKQRNPNAKVKEAVPSRKKSGLGLFPPSELPRCITSMPDISRRKGLTSSMIPRLADNAPMRSKQSDEKKVTLQAHVLNATAMDVDELQWNNSMYNIGR